MKMEDKCEFYSERCSSIQFSISACETVFIRIWGFTFLLGITSEWIQCRGCDEMRVAGEGIIEGREERLLHFAPFHRLP